MGNHPCTGLTFFPVCRQTSALLTNLQQKARGHRRKNLVRVKSKWNEHTPTVAFLHMNDMDTANHYNRKMFRSQSSEKIRDGEGQKGRKPEEIRCSRANSQESEMSKKCTPLWVRRGKQGQTKMKSRKTEKTETSGLKRRHSSEDIEPFAFEIASDSFSFPAWTHAQLFLQDPAPNAHGTRTEFPADRGVEFSVVVELAPSASGQYENVASTALSRWNSTTANQSGTGLTPEHLAARTALLGGQARLNANCSPRPTISNQSVTDEQVTPLLPSSNQEIETKCPFIIQIGLHWIGRSET